MTGRVDESNVGVWVVFGDCPPGRRNDPRWDGRLTHDADPIGFQAACRFGVGEDGEPGQVADEAFYLDVPRFSDDDDETIIVAPYAGCERRSACAALRIATGGRSCGRPRRPPVARSKTLLIGRIVAPGRSHSCHDGPMARRRGRSRYRRTPWGSRMASV